SGPHLSPALSGPRLGSRRHARLRPCLGACLGKRLGSCFGPGRGAFRAALVAFAAARRDDVEEIIAAIVVSDLVARLDVLDGAQEDPVSDRAGLGVGPARMIGIATQVPSGRAIDRPAAVDFVEIAVAARLQHVGLLGRELATLVLDNKGPFLDRRGCKEAEPGTRTAETKRWLARHKPKSTMIRASATSSRM